jgi:transcriptional regulator with XRE-family HTH domain
MSGSARLFVITRIDKESYVVTLVLSARRCQLQSYIVIARTDSKGAGMRVEEAIGRQIARLRAQRQRSQADLGEALGCYLGKPWSRQAVHQAERGQRSFTAAELTALALALDTSVQALFRAQDDQIELPGRAISPEDYRGILLNRQDTPLDGLEELIVALRDIGEVLERPALARLVRIARAAEQFTGPPLP